MVTRPHNTKRSKKQPIPIALSPEESAAAADLVYSDDREPGIRRKAAGAHFTYIGPDGKPVRDRETLARIKSLVIPPAWQDVWINPLADGHLQATGRDARNRKQYRYHPRWSIVRGETKFSRMIAFSEALPALRKRVEHDLQLPSLPREKVLAAVVRLLETSFIRVGNPEYAQTNKSYGLTTLRDRHVAIDGSLLKFKFRGKSGVEHLVGIQDRRLARIVKNCRDLPGQALFQYIGDDGEPHPINSTDVNAYLREICGQEFSAKDFRTWGGTTLAAQALSKLIDADFDSDHARQQSITQVIKMVAKQLGNTPTVCRKYYVHSAVLEAYKDKSLFTLMETVSARYAEQSSPDQPDLHVEEMLVVELLRNGTASSSTH